MLQLGWIFLPQSTLFSGAGFLMCADASKTWQGLESLQGWDNPGYVFKHSAVLMQHNLVEIRDCTQAQVN